MAALEEDQPDRISQPDLDGSGTVTSRRIASLRSGRARVMTFANAMMLLAFAFSMVVQVNDPDPWAWIAIYGAAAIVCGFALMGRASARIAVAVALTALAWAATIAPRVIGRVPFSSMFQGFEMRDLGVEESREMYGLLIVVIWMGIVAWTNRASAQRSEGAEHHR
jgi:hypothetical protein